MQNSFGVLVHSLVEHPLPTLFHTNDSLFPSTAVGRSHKNGQQSAIFHPYAVMCFQLFYRFHRDAHLRDSVRSCRDRAYVHNLFEYIRLDIKFCKLL